MYLYFVQRRLLAVVAACRSRWIGLSKNLYVSDVCSCNDKRAMDEKPTRIIVALFSTVERFTNMNQFMVVGTKKLTSTSFFWRREFTHRQKILGLGVWIVLRSSLDFSTLRDANRAAFLGLGVKTTGW